VRAAAGATGQEQDGALRRVVGGLDDERVAFPVTAGIAVPLLNVRRKVRTPVERDDARVVDGLLEDRHVILRLEDLDVAVVARAEPRGAKADAALRQATIFPGVGFTREQVALASCAPEPLGRDLFGCRSQRRYTSVGGIRDERRTVVELSLHEPELVVVSRLAVGGHELVLLGERRFEDLIAERGVTAASKELVGGLLQ